MRRPPGVPAHLRFKITGITSVPPGDNASYSTGSFTSLAYAHSVLTPPVATEVRFYLARDVDPATWVADHARDVPDASFRVTGPGTDFGRFLAVLQGAMSGAAAIAVFVGAFLIYL